ncbi:MAG TPA: outer membrane protein transport protein [Gemmatimonadaceae bacterium]|nr:outer membrane protein transport protein [Gemmatimonadaceae bacterium]
MKLARAAWCAALLAGLMPAAASAQGFQLNEIGSCAIGRGQAVTASPCTDASMIYWNPAATVELSGFSLYFGDAYIGARGSYTSDTTGQTTYANVPPAFPPNVFFNYTDKDHKWAAGIGMYVPYGLTNQWPNGFQGNFAGQRATIATFYVQPNVAYAISKDWSIGVGAVYGYSSVQLREALDISTQYAAPGVTFGMLGIPKYTQFASATVNGTGQTWGWAAGIHGKIGSDWQVGARYLAPMYFEYKNGTAKFQQVQTNITLAAGNPLGAPAGTPLDALLTPEFITPGGSLVTQGATAKIDHPWQAQLGLSYSGVTNWLFELDGIMSGWSVLQNIPITFTGPAAASSQVLISDYNDSWAIRAGAEHAFASGLKGRLGYSYVSTPVPAVSVDPTLPDQDRHNFMIGAGVPLGATWTLDAAYMLVYTAGRRGRVDDRTSESQTAEELNSGNYQLWANILSVSFKASW